MQSNHLFSLTDCSLLSEISEIDDLNFSNKHVRFTGKNNNFLNSSVISDASLLEAESKYYKFYRDQTIPDRNNNGRYTGPLNSPLTISDHKTVDEFTTIECHDGNDDTSVWSSETEESLNGSRTCSKSLVTSTPRQTLFQSIDRLPSALSGSSSTPAETIISDNVSESDSLNVKHDFAVPVVHSSKLLKDKISHLSSDLKYNKMNVSLTAKELAVKKLNEQLNMKDKFNENNSCAFVSRTPAELSKPLNIREDIELYPDLTKVDVRNESILVAQQKKLAAIRRRAGADKIQRKIEEGLPEPDILEFFEPSKHLFKSVNLSRNGQIINLKPTLSLADKRLYTVFRNRDLIN